MLTLLFIAQKNDQKIPVTVKEVGEFLGITSASASRNIAALSKYSRHKRAGHDLITTYENPERRIEKFIELTPKGKRVIETIQEYFDVSNKERSELASVRDS